MTCTTDDATFTASCDARESAGAGLTFSWDAPGSAEGGADNQRRATFTYDQYGTQYTVTVTVSGANGESDSRSRSFNFTNPVEPTPEPDCDGIPPDDPSPPCPAPEPADGGGDKAPVSS